MESNRHQRASALFLEVCDLPADERRRRLEEACGDDRELYREVLDLLGYDVTDAAVDGTRALSPE